MGKKIKKGNYLSAILRSHKTVFSTSDIALIWQEPVDRTAKERLQYYVRTGKLIRLRRGIYAKDSAYDRYELAVHILCPAYVSFESVLGAAGVTFQYSSAIFIASYTTREIVCDGQTYSFRKIKDTALVNPKGIDQTRHYSIATPERAFLDTVYKSDAYHFDNLGSLNWDRIRAILPIYESTRMEKRVEMYFRDVKAKG
ncbi:MAG: hypothetical protein AAB855_04510 [Patescibacteria group bacterium]